MLVLALLMPFVMGLVACKRSASEQRQENRSAVTVSDLVTIRTSQLGVDGKGPLATSALVSANNASAQPLIVVLEGDLVDAEGHKVATLRPDELRIPAHGSRLFALVDDGLAARPTATAARIVVRRAFIDQEPEPMAISDAHVYLDDERVVLAANLRNLEAKPAHAVVIGAFFDGNGAPMTRPFQVLTIGRETTFPIRMVGPKGSATGMLYLGEILY